MKIIPFKCSKCGVAFSYNEGGRCSQCNQLFCNNHLYDVKIDETTVILCENCKGEKKGKRKTNRLLKIRENLSKLQE